MAITLQELTNTDAEFYPTLGPFLANPAVHKAIGGVPWDEPTKTWIVAERDGQAAGFIAMNSKKRALLESVYAAGDDPQILARLLQAAVDRFGHDRDLHATVRHQIAEHFTGHGFAAVKEMTNFVTLVRRADVRR